MLGQRFFLVLDQALEIVGELLLHKGDAKPCPGAAHVRPDSGQVADACRDVLRLEAVLFDALQNVPQLLLRPEQALLRLQSVPQHVLQNDEEVLQRKVV